MIQRLRYIFIFLFILPGLAFSQKADSTIAPLSVKNASIHSPHKATLYSLCLPGLGQAYNKKYWKIPVVYAGLGAAAYLFDQNRKELNSTNSFFKTLYATGTEPTPQQIADRDDLRVNRDIAGITFVVLYVLQVIDATVDAHFYQFDINESLSIKPGANNRQLVSLTYQFR